jgi:hypothetical protein
MIVVVIDVARSKYARALFGKLHSRFTPHTIAILSIDLFFGAAISRRIV